MIKGKKITAIIPVRGGSKGIPRKNLYLFKGVTLLERTIAFAKESRWIDEIYVSTDDSEMYDIAKKNNVSTPQLRPKYLASDESKTIDTINHLITNLPIVDGYVLILQVTSPLRLQKDLDAICRLLEQNEEADGVVSVYKVAEPHPFKMVTIANNFIKPFIGNELSTPRQLLPDVWAFNGAFYMVCLDAIKTQNTLIPRKTIIYEMPPERSINIDSKIDLLMLELVAGQCNSD